MRRSYLISRCALPRMYHCHVLPQRREVALDALVQAFDGTRVSWLLALQAARYERAADGLHHCLHTSFKVILWDVSLTLRTLGY